MGDKAEKSSPNIKLREHRKLHHWTQAEMADILGVIDLTVRRWEQGQTTPSAYHVKKLCNLFEKTPEELGLFGQSASPDVDQKQVSVLPSQNVEDARMQDLPRANSLEGIPASWQAEPATQSSAPQGSVSPQRPALLSSTVWGRLLHSLVLIGLLCLSFGGGLLLALRIAPSSSSLPFPTSPVQPTRPPHLLDANNPTNALGAALASPLLYHDSLNDPNALETQEKHWTAIDDACFFAPDGYHVQGHNRSFCHETGAAYQNMTVTVDMVVTEGYSGGLLLRDQATQGHNGAYLFEVSTDGRYHITNIAMYGTIHNWTYSSALHRGRSVTNTLQVIASGNLFLFYLNGIYVTSVRDSWYESGGISFACFAQNGPCEATYHNLNVYLYA